MSGMVRPALLLFEETLQVSNLGLAKSALGNGLCKSWF